MSTAFVPSYGYGLIIACPSGDSVQVLGASSTPSSSPSLRTLYLSSIMAPKISRGKSNAQNEEIGAYQSRESLRKFLLGKRVKFQIKDTVGITVESNKEKESRNISYQYAIVEVEGGNNEDVSAYQVSTGWATVKQSSSPHSIHLLSLQEEAKKSGKGLWQSNKSLLVTRRLNFAPTTEYLNGLKGKKVNCIVDSLRDGSTFRLEIIEDDKGTEKKDNTNGSTIIQHPIVTVCLCGVQSPRTSFPTSANNAASASASSSSSPSSWSSLSSSTSSPSSSSPSLTPAEPFADEALKFSEMRLLSRDVSLTILSIDKSNNIFGQIEFPLGNISLKLLENGLGKYVPWSAALLDEKKQNELKEAEGKAKEAKIKIWGNDNGSASSSSSSSSSSLTSTSSPYESLKSDFVTRVIQVLSGDSVVVDVDGHDVRLSLSSLKTPKMGHRGTAGDPLSYESREFLRTKVIGHKVRVVIDYWRSPPIESADPSRRPFVSLFVNKVNLSELILQNGLGTVIKHRMDEDRSQHYDALIKAEEAAVTAKLGIHSGKLIAPKAILDLTDRQREKKDGKEEKKDNKSLANKSSSSKSKQYFSFLQRESGGVQAVVEFLLNPLKYKLFVPKFNVIIPFLLSGVKVPQDPSIDPSFSSSVLSEIKQKILNHNVKVEVITQDKGDNMIGSLWYNNGKNNLSVDLVRDGLAITVPFTAKKLDYWNELQAAETEARSAKKGLWKSYVPPVVPNENGEGSASDDTIGDDFKGDSTSSSSSPYQLCRITEIAGINEFYIRWLSDPNISKVEEYMLSISSSGNPPESFSSIPPVSTIAAGQFVDGSWHRVRVENATGEDQVRVNFIDFGNSESIHITELSPLPENIQRIPPLARFSSLAGIRHSRNVEYKDSAAQAFSDIVWERNLFAKVDSNDNFNKTLHLIIYLKDPTVKKAKKDFNLNDTSDNKENDEEEEEDDDEGEESVQESLLSAGWAKVNQNYRNFPRRGSPEWSTYVADSSALYNQLMNSQMVAKRGHFNLFEYGDVESGDEGMDINNNAKKGGAGAGKQRR